MSTKMYIFAVTQKRMPCLPRTGLEMMVSSVIPPCSEIYCSALLKEGKTIGLTLNSIFMKTEMKRNYGYVKYVSRACAFAVTLLVMAPAMLKGNSLSKAMTNEPKQLTCVVDDLETDEMISTIPEIQESQQEDPLGVAYLRNKVIQQIIPAIGNGVKANIVLTKIRFQTKENDVQKAYYIEHSFKDNNENHRPPEIRELIYHNIGKDKEYLGIKIVRWIFYEGNNSLYPDKIMESEVKLDDESAQFLLDFRVNETKWNNRTNISFTETTNPKVMPPQVY